MGFGSPCPNPECDDGCWYCGGRGWKPFGYCDDDHANCVLPVGHGSACTTVLPDFAPPTPNYRTAIE